MLTKANQKPRSNREPGRSRGAQSYEAIVIPHILEDKYCCSLQQPLLRAHTLSALFYAFQVPKAAQCFAVYTLPHSWWVIYSMTWPLALTAEGFRSTLARWGRETERNQAITPPLSRLLASSCKQGLPCWCNELSWWGGEFLQHLSCFVSRFGNVLSFKRSMRKTL